MSKNIRPIVILAALAAVLAIGVFAQQQSADKAVDPVCGMTVVKANAKATFDYKGATYYFCSTGCKEAFAKEPEKYLKARQAKAEEAKPAQMGMMKHGTASACQMGGQTCGQQCGQTGQGMPMAGHMARMGGHKGMMCCGRGSTGRPMMAPGMGRMLALYGDKVEMTVENTKDGAVLKFSSKDPEVAKAIQVHLSEHMTMMKKMKDAQAQAPAAAPDKECGDDCGGACGKVKK
ncbi:MAG TPA: YHS domain-containing protein [Candidatus Aminicenantes bacterium]|nr:YHS domain-containing protein [Candidatus Aminicenantes bacterium]HRY66210.1 YHS domain-containing protein [Candidatus Aminicenantes bacterium]HRZ73124.1 YHS domain-containing protein [Candidatus Aminicenantes bacterium]